MNYFDNHGGVSFGYSVVNGKITSYNHSFRRFKLYPRTKMHVPMPDVNTSSIYVPGMDGSIDTTETLDNVVHYKDRETTFEFVCFEPRERWDEIYHDLARLLHGKKMPIVLDDDPFGYYEGRFTVDEPEFDQHIDKAFFNVSGTLKPFQYGYTSTGEDWLWYPFTFTRGAIRRPYKELTLLWSDAEGVGGGNMVKKWIYPSDMPVTPNITITDKSDAVGSVTVYYNNIYRQTASADITPSMTDTTALFSDLIMSTSRGTPKEFWFEFNLAAGHTEFTDDDFVKLKIDYRTGRL